MIESNRVGNSSTYSAYFFSILGIGVLLYLIVECVSRMMFQSAHKHPDFYHFYTAAQALISGSDLYKSGTGGYIYTPLFAFLLTPLVALPYSFAQLTWLVVNLILIVVILLLGLRILASGFQLTFNRWQALGICSLAVLLSYNQIRPEWLQGQSDALILAAFTLALYWLDRRPVVAGVILGTAASIKYQAILFLPFLLQRGRWRVAAGLVIGIIAGALLPALMIGWHRNLEYLTIALRGLFSMTHSTQLALGYAAQVPSLTWYRNISVTSGLTRVFLDHGLQKNDVLIPLLAIAGLVFFLLWWIFRQYAIPFLWRTPQTLGNPKKEMAIISLEWGIVLMVMLIFSPQCTTRHLFLMLNVNLLAAMMLMLPRPRIKRWPLIIAIIIAQCGMVFPSVYWKHIGGPCWSLLPFLLLVTWRGLAYLERLPNG